MKQADENCDKLPPKVSMMIKLPSLPEKISALFVEQYAILMPTVICAHRAPPFGLHSQKFDNHMILIKI